MEVALMGLRFRKSINLGGGFRINLSKSGIGYSWGVKGYRITKTAKGGTRQTASIPGTGISYVTEQGKKKPQPAPTFNDGNHYDEEEIVNSIATKLSSEGLEDILAAARKTIRTNRLANIGMIASALISVAAPPMLLLFFVFLVLKIYTKTAGRIDLEYEIAPDMQQTIDKRLEPMFKITDCSKVWRITRSSKVIDMKYSSGAGISVKREPCIPSKKAPFPFKANTPAATFKSVKETLVFLPDCLFVLQGSKVGALHYADITTSTRETRFHEGEKVPKDATIVGHTWQYVNKTGGPDKRFKNNRQIPICLYGEITLKSTTGLNTDLMFSRCDL